MFPADLILKAETLSNLLRVRHAMLATAESCTGGLIAALVTELPGSSDVFERGYVTYTNEAKHENLDVPMPVFAAHGAVSEPVARAMATGALKRSQATVSVAVTGVAGPGGGSADKPVGLVHIAAQRQETLLHQECRFGDQSRSAIRLATIAAALDLVTAVMTERTD